MDRFKAKSMQDLAKFLRQEAAHADQKRSALARCKSDKKYYEGQRAILNRIAGMIEAGELVIDHDSFGHGGNDSVDGNGRVVVSGQLEVDTNRGVIYFHTEDAAVAKRYGTISILRICNLPKPIPARAIDITHMVGVDYKGESKPPPSKCSVCGSSGFTPSLTGTGCTFCDGTEGGNPPEAPQSAQEWIEKGRY